MADTFSESSQEALCPRTKECGDHLSSFSLGPYPCYVGLVSDTLSCFSSVVMVLIYVAWKDIRKKGAQSIVTFIAIADFLTAFAYLTGSVNMLVHRNETDRQKCEVFQTVCEIESYVVTLATMSSYLWTIILALFFYLTIAWTNANLATKVMPVYHIIAWGIPVAIAFPLLCANQLLYAPFVAEIWCYVDVHNTDLPFARDNLLAAVAVKLPEVTGYVLILILYLFTLRHIYKIHKKAQRSDQTEAVSRVEKILVFIPVLFIILRIWGTIQYFYMVYLSRSGQVQQGGDCIPGDLKAIYVTLGVLQALGGGGQGWANAILYIFLSPTIRQRLFCLPCKRRRGMQIQERSSTYYSPPISNYKSISTESIRNLM